MPRVLITPAPFNDPSATYFQPLKQAGFELVFPPNQDFLHDKDALLRLLEGIHAVLATTEKYTAEVLAVSKLRVVARAGVGFDSVDVAAATEQDVVVTITPGAVEISVAEQTLAMILGIYRNVIERDREVRSGSWKRIGFPRLAGKTLGIIGFGRIGRAVVPRAQAIGLNVIGHDPFADAKMAEKLGVELCDLDDLYARADIISLHAPVTPDTENMINAASLKKMRSDAVLINVGRGGLLDEADLYEAMSTGHLMGAALDVFKQEPLGTDSPLLTLNNVLLSSHTAGLDHQSQIDMPRIASQAIADLSQGHWPAECVVNKQLAGNWKW